jgi:parallel beta-helix repeat protein
MNTEKRVKTITKTQSGLHKIVLTTAIAVLVLATFSAVANAQVLSEGFETDVPPPRVASVCGCVGEHYTFTCGMEVNESCTFNCNMSCDSGHGLIVDANGITIDGDGYALNGIDSGACDTGGVQRSGIYNIGYDDVVVKNLEIKNFCNGIYFKYDSEAGDKVENITIENCDIHHNGGDTGGGNSVQGIKAIGMFDSEIKNCTIHHNTGKGTSCESGGNGIFLKGISAVGAWNNTITNNEIYENRKGGFFTKMKCRYTKISHNELWGNGQGGIILRCKSSSNHTIEFNNASYNYGDGIFIGGPNNTLSNNIVNNNIAGFNIEPGDIVGDGDGIDMGRNDGSFNNELYNNTVCFNEGTDIDTFGQGSGTTGDDNTCDTTSDYDDNGTTGCTYSCGLPICGCIGWDTGTVYKCGDLVNESCTFNCDLSWPCTDGLIVNAADIIIEGYNDTLGKRFAIDGSGFSGCNRAGIYNPGFDNVTVNNLTISGFCNGIQLKGSEDPFDKVERNTIYNCTVFDNTGECCCNGIYFNSFVCNSTVANCTIYDNSGRKEGVCSDCGAGVYLFKKSSYNNITGNEIYGNHLVGIYAKMMCEHGYVAENEVYENGESGWTGGTPAGCWAGGGIRLQCKMSNYWTVENNMVLNNYGPGLFVRGSSCVIVNNNVSYNQNASEYTAGNFVGAGYGIYLPSDAANNVVNSNTFCFNEYSDACDLGSGDSGDWNTCDTRCPSDSGNIICCYSCVPTPTPVFDTGYSFNPYPSIFGMHNGTITPTSDISVNTMYTYPCTGTGGHTEYVRLRGSGIDEDASWTGYGGDWHNITFDKTFTLVKGEAYNYTIRTGSYPQIIHASGEYEAEKGGNITCTKFTDANGKEHEG